AVTSATLTINPTPIVDDPADVTACDSYTLPALTNGTYVTGSGRTGTPLFAGDLITTTQTIYVFAQTGTVPNCSAETSFLVTINNCTIILEKIASPNNSQGCTPVAPGESITYTFNVSNPIGNSPINNVELRDPLIDPTNNPLPGPDSGDTSNPGVLDAGETWVYTASYIVTQQDIINGQVQNTATVTGLAQTSGNPFPVSNTDTVTVTLCQNAEMSIVKSSTSATGDCISCGVGTTVDYEFVVSNDGDVDITNVVITDPLFLAPNPVVPILLVSGDDGDGILNVGEVWIYNASYSITQENIDFGSVVNTASVNGNTALGTIDAISNTVTVLICQDPSIAIVKTGIFTDVDGNHCADAGIDTIAYTFTVTNEGNVSLSNILVTDPLLEAPNPVVDIVFQGGDTDNDGELDVNESWTYTATAYTITQDDIDAGEVVNQATVSSTDTNGNPLSDVS